MIDKSIKPISNKDSALAKGEEATVQVEKEQPTEIPSSTPDAPKESESQEKGEEKKKEGDKEKSAPKPQNEQPSVRFSGLSIKSALEDKPAEEKLVNTEDLPQEPIEAEQLKTLWMDYLKEIKATIAPGAHGALQAIEIEKGGDSEIRVICPSYTAQSEFEDIRTEFLKRAHRAFNNFHIAFDYQIKESEDKHKAFSKEEIFQDMLKKNPALDRLRKELGLDLYD